MNIAGIHFTCTWPVSSVRRYQRLATPQGIYRRKMQSFPTGVGKLALKLFCPLYLQSGVRSPECGESLAIAAVEPFLPMNSTHNKSHPYSQHGLVAILRDKCTYKLCQCAFTSMVTCTIGEPQRIQQLGQKRDVCQ